MRLFSQIVLSGLAMGAIYAMVALGFAFYLRAMRLLNFSHGEILMVGAFIGLYLTTTLGLPFLLTLPLAVVATALFGVALERVVYRKLWVTSSDEFLIRTVFATLAMGILLTHVLLHLAGPLPRRYPAPLGDAAWRLGALVVSPQGLLILIGGILTFLALQLFFVRTKLGLGMRAVMLDRDTAQLMGIDVRRYISLTFALSSGLAALAGVLIAPIVLWRFDMGLLVAIKSFAGLTLGGLYSFPGAVAGGLLVGLLESFSGLYLSSTYRDAIVFGVLVLMLLVRPQGLFGKQLGRVG